MIVFRRQLAEFKPGTLSDSYFKMGLNSFCTYDTLSTPNTIPPTRKIAHMYNLIDQQDIRYNLYDTIRIYTRTV